MGRKGKWKGSISEVKDNLSEVIGKTYGIFTILEVMDSFDGKEIKRICKCQCPCGNISYRKFPETLYGNYMKKHCCSYKGKTSNTISKEVKIVSKEENTISKEKDYSYLIGKTFGELVVLEICQLQLRAYPSSKGRYKRQACVCRCSCGKIIVPKIYSLLEGYTKSCGHFSRRSVKKNFTFLLGTKLGRLNILSVANLPEEEKVKDRTEYVCKCECGFKLVLSINDIATKTLTKCPACKEDFLPKKEEGALANGFGLKNISWSEKEQHFVISIKRGNRYFKSRAISLDGAIEKRSELLKEADDYSQTEEYFQSLKEKE